MSAARFFLGVQRWLAAGTAAALLVACGGGGGGNGTAVTSRNAGAGVASVASPTIAGSNLVQIVVDTGTDGSAINSPFVTVRVCQPGTAICRDIDHVVLDTGSTGLRVAASAVAGMTLPTVASGAGLLAECANFASGYSWGAVRTADVKMGGESAAGISIHVIDDTAPNFSAVPAGCSGTGSNISSGRGAKGILGTGLFVEDCGAGCVAPAPAPNVYYSCTNVAACTAANVPLASQVTNPVAKFASANNNGVAVVLPAVPSGGAALATGWLVFGIGTAANNAIGSASIYRTDANGNFTTTYKGVARPNSFLDTGSNGYFFNDNLPTCGDFYCPPATLSLSATNASTLAPFTSGTVTFPLDSVLDIRSDAAAAHIGGTNGLPGSFDWGLPFFFGRTVFVGISGRIAGAATGPFWAY